MATTYKTATGSLVPSHAGRGRRQLARSLAAWMGSVSVAAMQVLPAYADVVAVAGSGTSVNAPSANDFDVTTTRINGSTAFNQFSEFNVGAAQTVDLYQPNGADKLVNIISGGSSTVDGFVNAKLGDPSADLGIGGDVYFVNSNGFVVSQSGVINAGKLTISTPTADFVNGLIDEAQEGALFSTQTQRLFAGTEPLSDTGVIDIQGDIFATRLDMRAGLRMIVDGSLTIETQDSGGIIAPAVNADGVPSAGGVSIGADGVIRLVSEGTMDLGGTVSAKGQTSGGTAHGGLVTAEAKGDMTVGGSFDVSNGAGDAGAVLMFTEGSATMEPALVVTASSTSGAGGFFTLRADGDSDGAGDIIDAQGVIDTGSQSGANGEVFLLGENVTIGSDTLGGSLTTLGGSLGISAAEKVTVENDVSVSTRHAGSGTGDDYTAGDLIVVAPEIDIQSGAVLDASGAGDENGGFLALIARNQSEGIAWAINPDSEVAKITITEATIDAGAVVISAVAKASNVLGSDDDAVEAAQVDSIEQQTTEEQFEALLDSIVDSVTTVMERGLTTVNGLIPVQVQVLSAEATVTITDTAINADGNLRSLTPTTPDTTETYASSGYLSSIGLREDGYSLMGEGPYGVSINLPSMYDPANDSLLVHSYAETTVSIAPKAYGMGLAVAVTNTDSQIKITDSALTTLAGNMRLAATAAENHTISIAAKKIANGAAAVAVTVRNLSNQLVVQGGSMDSAGSIAAGAFTGRMLSTSNVANSGTEGRVAIAVSVDVSESLTEAAIGGTITAGGDVTVDAENLYFGLTRINTATMGVANAQKVIQGRIVSLLPLTGFASTLQQKATGKTPDPNRKAHFGMGVAVDVQLNNDNTYATIGGSYHDFNDVTAVPIALGTTSVTAAGQNIDVNAVSRFAHRVTEGGSGLSRSTSASFGTLTAIVKKMVEAYNAANPSDPIGQDELLGRYSDALMLNASVSSMMGETQAEIGADATVTGGTLDVFARTHYPNSNPVENLIAEWDAYVAQVTEYQEASEDSTLTDPALPPAPDLGAFLDSANPLTYLTTDSKAKAEASVADDRVVAPGEEQGLAIGVTLTYFNTDNATTAVIRDGATVDLETAATVKAVQEALFLHVVNLPKKIPLSGDAKVESAVGGGIHFARTVSSVRAEIESGATVTVTDGTLEIDAQTRNITGSLAYSGGQGSDVAINASIAALISEADTVARIGEASVITATDVSVTAKDSSVAWLIAGAISGSEHVGVGASGVFNFSSRNIWAGIGPADRTADLSDASVSVIDADTLTILAENDTLDVTIAVAGTKVVGKPDTPSGTEPDPNGSEDDMIIPSWLFSEEENDAANAQSNVDVPQDQDSATQKKSGWAISGAAVVNLALANETSAEILTNNRLELSDALSVTARSNAVAVNVGGAVSAGLGTGQDTNALAGAFAVHVDSRVLRSRIVNAEINAGGAVTVEAEDLATIVNVAVGGAGTSRGDIALAGSVAVAVLSGDTTAEALETEITSGQLTIKANDTSTTVSVGGAVGVNLDATQGYGVGLGVAWNTITRSAVAQISGAGSVTTGALLVQADSTQSIYGFGTSAGVGKTGLAGSVNVNTITGGAIARVVGPELDPEADPRDYGLTIEAASATVQATEENTIFSLAGALAGGRSTAVGASLSLNIITATTEARLENVLLSKEEAGVDLGAVSVTADGRSTITSISVAGAAATEGDAAGIGLAGNEITATVLTSLQNSTVVDAGSLTATADGARDIFSIAGGLAASTGGAGGAGVSINLLLANDTKVLLDNAVLSTRTDGGLSATATASGTIKAGAVGISASRDTSVGGAITVNVTTATTQVSATHADLTAGGVVELRADDTAQIFSLAGGAAFSAGGAGVGAAVSANFIAHDTAVVTDGGSVAGNGVTLQAVNSSDIKSAAIGLSVSGGSAAIAGSVAIGDIGNTTRVRAAGTTLDAGSGSALLDAGRTGSIKILSGSAAGSGGGAGFGAALTVATIHGGATADLITDGDVVAADLTVTARSSAEIEAAAVSGAAAIGSVGGAGSVVYTQIGRPTEDGPSVTPISQDESDDPLGDAQTTAGAERDGAITDLSGNVAGLGGLSLSEDNLALALDTDDVVRARVQLTGTAQSLPALTIETTDSGSTKTLAGAIAGGATAGVGVGIAVNLMFGKAEAELVLPSEETTTVDGAVIIGVTQTGNVDAVSVAGGGGGTVGGAGSVTVNVMNRQAMARLIGATPGSTAALIADGQPIALQVTQSGTIDATSGSVGIGGTAGVGGAIVVNVMSDDAESSIENIVIDTASSSATSGAPLGGAGAVSTGASQTMTFMARAVAASGSGTGAFAGSFAINVADGEVIARLKDAEVSAGSFTLSADATPTLTASAGAVSASGAAVGLGVATNVTTQLVRADVDGSKVYAHDAVKILASSATTMGGMAISGAVGGVAVTGSAVSNTSANTVEALVRDTDAPVVDEIDDGSDVATAGSVLIAATGTSEITLYGGTDESGESDEESDGISVNLSFAGGGTAGIGASATVNSLSNDVRAAVEGNSRVIGLGHRGVEDAGGAEHFGVVINASGSGTINMFTANGGIGGVAGVAALFAMNLIDDKARVEIGTGAEGERVQINAVADDLESVLGTTDAAAQQDTILTAVTDNEALALTANVAIGGSAGVGAGSGNTLVTNLAKVAITDAIVEARDNIDIDARANTSLQTVTLGLSGGFVGVTANAGVNRIASEALVALEGARLTSGGDLRINSHVDSDSFGLTGAGAGGVVGASGGVQVTLFDSTSRISIGTEDPDAESALASGGEMALEALTELETSSNAVSGSIGAGALALAANISLVEATTEVAIGSDQSLISQDALTIRAKDTATIDSISGSVGAGGLGVGASFDYVSFSGATNVFIGDRSYVEADPGAQSLSSPQSSTQTLTIEALSERDVSSAVVAIGAGGIAFSGALSIVELGSIASDDDDQRADFLSDAQSELSSDQSGDSGKTGDDQKNTAGALIAYAGGTETQDKVVASRQAIDLTDTPGEDVVGITLGTDAVLKSRGSVTLEADAKTAVTQIAGGGAASLFGGSTSGVAVTNVGTGSAISLGAGSRILADGNITLTAANGAFDGRDLINSQAATLAASVGYSVGVGVSVAKLSGTSSVSLGDGAEIAGAMRTNAAGFNVSALRSGIVKTDTFNVAAGFSGAAGMAVSHAINEGATVVQFGSEVGSDVVQISADTVALKGDDTSRVEATGEGSTGGVGAGLNAVIITADVESTGTMNLYHTEISGKSISLSNETAASAYAEARGIAIGAFAAGASVAHANMNAALSTSVDAAIDADTIALSTRIYRELYDHASAYSASTAGGLLAGSGAESSAYANYDVSAAYQGRFDATETVRISTDAASVVTYAETSGKVGGLAAIGVTIARAGQNMDLSDEDARLASVTTSINDAQFTTGTLEISSGNAPSSTVKAESGSGGVVSGSGSETRVTTNTATTTTLGTTGAVVVNADNVTISTAQTALLAGTLNTMSAAAIGASGADSRTSATSVVTTQIGGQSTIRADNFDISANTSMERPEDGFNIVSGSGGAIDVAAMVSRVDVSATTDVFVDDGAMLMQTGETGANQTFAIGTYTNMALFDRLKLDAGGAIAIPSGNTKVRVNTNDATVTIGDATLFSVDTMTLYSGGDANLKAEVDTTSYGLAGAATGSSEAVYNADNRVVIADGATLESLSDVKLQAGYGARQAQSVTVNAETRVFNKTAIPIPTDPEADAVANTSSIVDIQEGSSVKAVQDVYLLAEAGSREVVGYGRGKDLYREALAALGSAFSEAFGGEPVSLDIESGSSSDTSNDGILVNGYVRAGSRNKQILILNENNELDNSRLSGAGYTDDMAEGIDYSIRENVELTSEIQSRIDVLDALLNDPAFANDEAAKAAWNAEKEQLVARASQQEGTATFLDLEDIVASEGNIILRADYVHGTDTGTLDAPGNAEIIVHTYADTYINTAGMIIPENAGGRITFNDVQVQTTGDIAALSDPTRVGATDYEMISGAQAGDPLIEVVTYGDTAGIIVGGAIYNADGIARFNSNNGDLDVRSDISAKTVELSAGGDFIQGYTVGFTEIEGDPGEIYESYFEQVEELARKLVLAGYSIDGPDSTELTVDVGGVAVPVGALSTFNLAPRKGRIKAGRNVYITADMLNINGLVQAGTGSYDVSIDAGLDDYIADLVRDGVEGTVTLYDPSEPVYTDPVTGETNVIRNAFIESDVYVKYDPNGLNENGEVTGKIIIDPMVVQGGIVELTGQVFSTGGGEIVSLDGFGTVNVDSASSLPIELGRVDLGALGENGQGIEGVVRITDTGRGADPENGDFLVTEFRRIGNQFQEWDNSVYTIDEIDYNDDGVVDLERVVPLNLKYSTTTDDGREGSYATKEGVDFVINRSERVTQDTTKTQTTFYFWAPFSSSVKSRQGEVKATELTPEVAPGLTGVYLADDLAGDDYAYHFSGRRVSNSVVSGPVSTNDKRILGIGDVVKTWTETQTAINVYTHRLKADYGVKISFEGSDTGGLNIVNGGDVVFTGAVNNQVGNTTISSTGGSIFTSDSSVLLSLGQLSVSALGGQIGGYSTAFRIDQNAGTTLTAIARDSIDIREMDGDMTVASVETTDRSSATGTNVNGEVTLSAEGSILMEDATSLITGASIDLRSYAGSIGTEAQSVRVFEDGATLSARANGGIYLEETQGDFNVRTVVSELGSVELMANDGAILDRNDVEVRDVRTESELAILWTDELGLNGDSLAARKADQLEGLNAERKQTYADYWKQREQAGGAPQTYVMDADLQQSLLDGSWTQEQLDSYLAERQALYDTWNAQSTYDVNSEVLSADEQLAHLDGIEWTSTELNEWIRAGLIRGTGDTNVRVEDPNISASGDITLIARDAVGELLDDYVLGNDRAEDLRVLSTAERADVTIDEVTNTVTVSREEDVNFAFTQVDENGHALGSLRVSSNGQDIFLGAETAATIADVTTTSDVRIKIDGHMTDNRDGDAAVTGSAIIVEAGNEASIGEADNPLTFDVLSGGSLIARAGHDVFVRAIGDLPLQELYAGGVAEVTALGAITDDAGTGAVRVRAADLTLDGGSIGTAETALVIEVTDAEDGALELVTRSGDAYVTAESPLALRNADLFGGGEITATSTFALLSEDTITFGADATLSLIAPQGIDLSASSGTDVSGGTLVVRSGGGVGTVDKRLQTALSSLSFFATGEAVTPLYVTEEDDLRLATVVQTHLDADTIVDAGGALSVGTITSVAEVRLLAEAITEGRIVAERIVLSATGENGAIGGTARMDLTSGSVLASTTDGDIRMLLRDRATDLEAITAGGQGGIDLISTDAPVTLLSGAGITTEGGDIDADLTGFVQQANVLSHGGDIRFGTTESLTQSASTRIDSGLGTLDVTVDGDMVLAQLQTLNDTAQALSLNVGGTLSVAEGQTQTQLVANAEGALTTLRLGGLTPLGPTGLEVALAALDAEVSTGPIHLNELDGIDLRHLSAANGMIDVFAHGRTVIGDLTSENGDDIVISASAGDMVSDGATLSGGDVRLFAFGGDMAGETTDTFMGDAADGVTVHLLAQGDLRYTETQGDLRVGFALSDTGDLELDALAGGMELGVLGAAGSLRLAAQDDLRVTIIGGASVDLADEIALNLVEPSYYGTREAQAPELLDLIAYNPGSTLYAGLLNAKGQIGLHADNIDVHLYDARISDPMLLTIDDSDGGLADHVDVQSIGDGPVLFMSDYFADVRPRLAGRTSTDGTLILTRGLIGEGQVTHAGPSFIGDEIVVGGDVWFRQRSFDLLAGPTYEKLSTEADAQVLALYNGEMTFEIHDEIELVTIEPGDPLDGTGGTVLVLNRRLGGVELNGGQGFAFGVGVETDILGYPFTFEGSDPGVTEPEILRDMMELYEERGILSLPRFISAEDNGSLCPGQDSALCVELSMVQ